MPGTQEVRLCSDHSVGTSNARSIYIHEMASLIAMAVTCSNFEGKEGKQSLNAATGSCILPSDLLGASDLACGTMVRGNVLILNMLWQYCVEHALWRDRVCSTE